ncbi:MAG: MotA/TolQ/ExbB proton channel family protein [Panacagrimonas sp.]
MNASADRAALREMLDERARGTHEAGWFLSSLLLKLGLLGTIVGFVFMLGALAIKTLSYADLPRMLGRMGSGMGISLYTTLVGLLANVVYYACAFRRSRPLIPIDAGRVFRGMSAA